MKLLIETSDGFVIHLSKLDFRVVYIVLGSHHMAAEVYNFSSANQLKAVEHNFLRTNLNEVRIKVKLKSK